MGYRHHGVDTGGIPVDYIRRFVSTYDIPIFIETGTAGGESVRAASPMFTRCHTIEIVEGRADGEYPSNVQLHTGNSGELIADIVKLYKNMWIFFWLDAHWSEPDEAADDVAECPLISEIKAIDHRKSIVMIDDARLFLGPPPWPCNPRKWPKFKDVIFNLQYKFPDHNITVVDDYIVAIPEEMKGTFFEEWRGRFLQRYPSDEAKLKQSVKLSYEALKQFIE